MTFSILFELTLPFGQLSIHGWTSARKRNITDEGNEDRKATASIPGCTDIRKRTAVDAGLGAAGTMDDLSMCNSVNAAGASINVSVAHGTSLRKSASNVAAVSTLNELVAPAPIDLAVSKKSRERILHCTVHFISRIVDQTGWGELMLRQPWRL